jgi:hypothetical protein
LARDFLDKSFADDAPAAGRKTPEFAVGRATQLFDALKQKARREGAAGDWRHYGDALVLWGGNARVNDALDAFDRARQLDPKDGPALFRLGVCYRLRYDSEGRCPGDFQAAIDAWNGALQLEPNRYIWRRRIQQYGPRLDQPYAFFDWVEQARREIIARGWKPVALAVPLVGAEIARPVKQFPEASAEDASPDPDGKIHRDKKNLIETETTVIPSRVRPNQAARVQIVFRPNVKLKAHWNNEGTPLKMWVDAPSGWKVTRHLLTSTQPKEAESNETRTLDFEVQAPAKGEGSVRLPVYVLYNVCEDTGGKCLFLRKDIEIQFAVSKQYPRHHRCSLLRFERCLSDPLRYTAGALRPAGNHLQPGVIGQRPRRAGGERHCGRWSLDDAQRSQHTPGALHLGPTLRRGLRLRRPRGHRKSSPMAAHARAAHSPRE